MTKSEIIGECIVALLGTAMLYVVAVIFLCL
jgi:hypothetical protein